MAVEPEEIELEEYNKRITAWGSKTGSKLRDSIRLLTNTGKGDLVRLLRLKTAKWFGEVDKLSYHFPRHGVFVHKGVGRGYYMEGGRVLKGNSKVLKDKSANVNDRLRQFVLKSAAPNRKPKEWFNPIVQENIESLADMVAEMDADKMVNATKILIR